MKYLSKILVSYLCLGIALSLSAQPNNLDSLSRLSIYNLLKLSVDGVSKYSETSSKAPATVLIITKEQIANNNWTDLSDVLKNAIGIDYVEYARGYGEFYTIRGIEGNDRFLILIDGQKINPVSGTFISVGNSISIDYAERIEIIYGPASVMYGADAFAGIINIVSKNETKMFDIKASLNYGSFNSTSGQLTFNHSPSEDFSVLLSGNFFSSDGPDFMERDTIYNIIQQYPAPYSNNFEQPINDYTIFLKARYKTFTLSFFNQKFDEGNAYGQNLSSIIYNEECKWAFQNRLLFLQHEKKLGQKSTLSSSIAYINFAMNPESQFFKWKKDKFLEESFSQYLTGSDNTLRAMVLFNTNLMEHIKLVSGIEMEYTQSIPPYANDQIFAQSLKFEGEVAETIKDELTITEERIAGLSQMTFTSEKFSSTLGGRYDFSLRNGGTFNPRMSVVFSPSQSMIFKAMYGTAFQAPSLFYQYEQWGAVSAVMLSVDEINNTEPSWRLENQKIQTFEFSAFRVINKSVIVSVSANYSYLSNLIRRNIYTDSAFNKYFSNADTTVFSTGVRNENSGKQEVYGVNLKMDYIPNDNLSVFLSYSFLDAYTITNTVKEPLPRISPHKIKGGITYTNLFDMFTISLYAKWFGKINNRNAIVFPNGQQDGFVLIDLNVNYRNNKLPVTMYVRIENLLNTNYQQGGMFDQVIYHPTSTQTGITARFGIIYNFIK